MIDFEEINFNALGLAGLLSMAIYWALFIQEGMDIIPLAARIIALVVSFVGGYLLGQKLLEG